MKLLSWILVFSVFAPFYLPLSAAPNLVTVSRPTVIAFFAPMTQAELSKDPVSNEALADFEVYVAKARPRLREAHIDFDVIYASSFDVKSRSKTKSFHPKMGVGYYFVQPGKSPLIEYGVMTDLDMMHVATEYFRLGNGQ